MSDNSQLIGTWTLKSFALHLTSDASSQPIFHPLGTSPLGRIMFKSDGYMSCTLTNPEAFEGWASPTWFLASEQDIAGVARPMTTYCGPYRVYEENGKSLLSTDVEIALDPSWVGKPQVRQWEVKQSGGKTLLVLRPVQEFLLPDGTPTKAIVVWEKWGEVAKL
ncbi:hypothetical protein BFW01_g7387 [Lasiodiplodia theobromae]|uniref:uncharacterized protein n=1 Tax=Lasiodiplodia theobromae TaxID=45133 RepID=UPI0015C34FD4|nr:uncharacterized protein LTHEOB_10412 [Lasiodiplodia theobromae]KAF4539248.1 hypothetical protein LTHEOB_10412 [Lasiodiplodia theobromae]KAF9636491.1 hypothetical protein BFW01_g7387 [Lasiodiplodia theobromae]